MATKRKENYTHPGLRMFPSQLKVIDRAIEREVERTGVDVSRNTFMLKAVMAEANSILAATKRKS